jgi:hypothetical protein
MEHYTMNKAETEHANATGARIVKILPTVHYTAGQTITKGGN